MDPEIALKEALIFDKINRKKLREATDKRVKKAINKELKKNQDRIPMLKRKIYEKKKRKEELDKPKKQREAVFAELQKEKERKRYEEKVLEQKEEKNVLSFNFEGANRQSQKICPSCDSVLRDVYGVTRCKCN